MNISQFNQANPVIAPSHSFKSQDDLLQRCKKTMKSANAGLQYLDISTDRDLASVNVKLVRGPIASKPPEQPSTLVAFAGWVSGKVISSIKFNRLAQWSSNLQKETGSLCCVRLQKAVAALLSSSLELDDIKELFASVFTKDELSQRKEDIIFLFSKIFTDAFSRIAGEKSEDPFVDGMIILLQDLQSQKEVLSRKYDTSSPNWRIYSLGATFLHRAFPNGSKDLKAPFGLELVCWNEIKGFCTPSEKKMERPLFFNILAKIGLIDDPVLENRIMKKKGGKAALFFAKITAQQAVYYSRFLKKDVLLTLFQNQYLSLGVWSYFWAIRFANLLERSKALPWLLEKLIYAFLLQEFDKLDGKKRTLLSEMFDRAFSPEIVEPICKNVGKRPEREFIKMRLKDFFRSLNLLDPEFINVFFQEIHKFYPADSRVLTDSFKETIWEVYTGKKENRENFLECLAECGCEILVMQRDQNGRHQDMPLPNELLQSAQVIGTVILKSMKREKLEGVVRSVMKGMDAWQGEIDRRWKIVEENLYDPSLIPPQEHEHVRDAPGATWNEKLFHYSGVREARETLHKTALIAGQRLAILFPRPYRFSFIPVIFEGLLLRSIENLLRKGEDPQVPKLPSKEHPKTLLPVNIFSYLLDVWNQNYLRNLNKPAGRLLKFEPFIDKVIDLIGKDLFKEMPFPEKFIEPLEHFSQKTFLPSAAADFHDRWMGWQKRLPQKPEEYLAEFYMPGRGHALIEASSRYSLDYLQNWGKTDHKNIAGMFIGFLKEALQPHADNRDYKDVIEWVEKHEKPLSKFLATNIEVFFSLNHDNVKAFWKEIEKQMASAFFVFAKGLSTTWKNIQDNEPRILEFLSKDLMVAFHEHMVGFNAENNAEILYQNLSNDLAKEGLAKEELREEFYKRTSHRLFCLAGVEDPKQIPFPDCMQEPLWSLIKDYIAPKVIKGVIEAVLKSRDTFAYNMMDSLNASVENAPQEVAANAAGNLEPLIAFPEFNEALGECLKEISEILPSIFKKFLFHRIEEARREAQGEMGNKIRRILSKTTFLQLVDRGIKESLPSFREGKWIPQRINEVNVEIYQPDYDHFNFRHQAVKRVEVDKNILRERVISKIEESMKSSLAVAIQNKWREFQQNLDDAIAVRLGPACLEVKKTFDPWFRYLFITGFGSLLGLLLWPVKHITLALLRIALRAKIYQVHRAMDHELHEVLVYRAIHKVLTTFEKLKPK